MWSTTKLDIFNRNGARLCEAFGCRKHTRLRNICGGIFCLNHCLQLTAIRQRIKTGVNKIEVVQVRVEEQIFRKIQCARHMHCILSMNEDLEAN
jgi:hypothetical protein